MPKLGANKAIKVRKQYYSQLQLHRFDYFHIYDGQSKCKERDYNVHLVTCGCYYYIVDEETYNKAKDLAYKR